MDQNAPLRTLPDTPQDAPAWTRRAALAGGVAALLIDGTSGSAADGARQGSVLPQGVVFRGLTGSDYALDAWRGRPMLVVNTASLCGFTAQYDDLQALHTRFGRGGLVVLAVPSNDFRQELGSDAEVARFCEVNFALEFPITTITPVRGPQVHPFYRWLASDHGFAPDWNFNKVLIGRRGEVLGTWRASTRPTSRTIRRAVEAALAT